MIDQTKPPEPVALHFRDGTLDRAAEIRLRRGRPARLDAILIEAVEKGLALMERELSD